MNGFIGMDVASVRTLASQLHAKADEIDSIAHVLTGTLGHAHWVGNDANNFRSDWHNTHLPQLSVVANALRTASQHATANANQQEEVSNH